MMKNLAFATVATVLVMPFTVHAQEAAADAAEAAKDAMESAEAAVAEAAGRAATPQERARNPQPTSDNWDLIKQADYPAGAWKNDVEGRTDYQLDITEEGRVSKCLITRSSGSSSLDEATCQIMTERGRFEPGTNEAGEPVPSKFMGDHRWRKRDNDMPDFAVRIDFLMDERGEPTQCSFEKLRGDLPPSFQRQVDRAENGNPCKMVPGRVGVPYRDENGAPVAKRVSITMDARVTDPE